MPESNGRREAFAAAGRLALAGLIWMAGAGIALAQSGYPARPVRILVGSPAGSTADMLARPLATRLTEALGAQFIVDNRAGATGMIANELVARATPDGHTLLIIPGSQVNTSPHVNKTITYKPLQDYAPVMQLNAFGYALIVNPGVPVKSVPELIALARAKSGGVTFGSSGIGSGFHLAGELFQRHAKVEMLHVPYKGSPPAIIDVIAGRVNLMFVALGLVKQHVDKGALRLLAMTGVDRDPLAPSVPTVAEAGLPGYEASGWHGILAPAGTPAAIVNKLNQNLVKIMQTPEMQDNWAKQGMKVVTGTPQEFAARMKREYESYGRLIKEAGIQPQ